MLYSKTPLPVAFTRIVPVFTVQVGWVRVGAVTFGAFGTGLMVTGLPLNAVVQVGLDASLATML